MKLFRSLFRTPATVKLEIEPSFLASLLANGQIHATDFHCLDISSKQIVWKILLSLAKSKLTETGNYSEATNPQT